ncbi:CDP-glucose 4,6-dehydratase [Paraconexibacter sp. AEG42_29]|uniref:CDP-glucose 4,6-dehydratase n=1 Tax=Paraconexibacter sp. AEG42_29 TaxID=2997339 RepID=A0AAU7B299_9ACTN
MTDAPPDQPDGTVDPAFWRGRRVLLTGHTGFKGAWLALWLQALGAEVTGFADEVPTTPSIYALAGVADGLRDDIRADIRDADAIDAAMAASRPDVVIHMAAQPMVRRSFAAPRETYAVNVMGTVNVLDAVRTAGAECVRAVVVVTSDKCYDNYDGRAAVPFVESDRMGGHDPYSSSKGAAELVTDAYRRSYFDDPDGLTRVASGRAGNVIGGGDWGEDRLVPDIMRAATDGSVIDIRRPDAIRPWQHVLSPLSGYLVVAQALCAEAPRTRLHAADGWNFGPSHYDAVQPVSWITERLTALWPDELRWQVDPGPHPHEATHLSLDSHKARRDLGWKSKWTLERTLESIVAWHLAHRDGADLRAVTLQQIEEFTAS